MGMEHVGKCNEIQCYRGKVIRLVVFILSCLILCAEGNIQVDIEVRARELLSGFSPNKQGKIFIKEINTEF